MTFSSLRISTYSKKTILLGPKQTSPHISELGHMPLPKLITGKRIEFVTCRATAGAMCPEAQGLTRKGRSSVNREEGGKRMDSEQANP